MKQDKYIVAIEIGSSKIIAGVGTVDNNGKISIIATEEEKLVDSVRYGCVKNIEEIIARLSSIIKKLGKRNSISPRKIKSVFEIGRAHV